MLQSFKGYYRQNCFITNFNYFFIIILTIKRLIPCFTGRGGGAVAGTVAGAGTGGGGFRRARSSGFGYAMALKLAVLTGKESTI